MAHGVYAVTPLDLEKIGLFFIPYGYSVVEFEQNPLKGHSKRSELLDGHGRKQTHQTTGEEEDLPDLLNMQVLLPQSDSHVPECWQLWDIIPTPYHWVGGRGGPGQHCTIYTYEGLGL